MDFSKQIDLSIVIPFYNEMDNIAPLVQSVHENCQNFSFEIILVDDGSTDSSLMEAHIIANKIKQARIIPLKKNFGQTAALAAGIDVSKGRFIIPLDADGQNDPADIPILLEKIKEGYDVVSGWRKDRKDTFITRKLPSWLANALISTVTGVHLHDYGCTIKAYRGNMIRNIQLSGEMHRFLPAWCAWRGGKVTELPVRHHPRTRGQSKYGLFRIFKVLIDLMTVKFFSGYLSKPNYLFSGTAFVLFSLSLLTTFFALIDKFALNLFPKYRLPFLLLGVFLGMVSIFFVFIGLLAELLVRLYFTVRDQKPYVIVDEKVN